MLKGIGALIFGVIFISGLLFAVGVALQIAFIDPLSFPTFASLFLGFINAYLAWGCWRMLGQEIRRLWSR